MSGYENEYEEFLFHRINDSDLLTGFVVGHLVIEHLLEEIVLSYDSKLREHFLSLTHSRKISFINSLGLVPDGVASCLQSINKMRNKFAHQLGYEPNKGELLNLITKCRENFDDLTDGLVQLHGALTDTNDLLEAQEKHGVGLADLFIQVVYDLESYANKEV
ncbi:hypothetical protein H9C73_15335 [Marinobacterium sp. AK62]|uniref:DUF4145 domain-containing protein n=1 Tax=Marinobacterium alkalitolerans TaxID=1542925 RepID=A0ABS3ZGE3_9GAMM|nr:hypothetical protein [Marinobacterium alkalitolerans]MBP0050099.1 hypothetical protein [Marinobacterium alkalitolerans]